MSTDFTPAPGAQTEPGPVARRPARRLARLGLRLGIALGSTVLVGIAAVTLVVFPLTHTTVEPVLSGSMRPAFSPGDAVLVRAEPVTRLHPGQVAVFVPPGESAPVAHRVTSVTGNPSHPVITTKGDANPLPDRWRAELPGPSVPVVVATLPHIGRLLVPLNGPRQHAAIIALLGLLATFLAVRTVLHVPIADDTAGPGTS